MAAGLEVTFSSVLRFAFLVYQLPLFAGGTGAACAAPGLDHSIGLVVVFEWRELAFRSALLRQDNFWRGAVCHRHLAIDDAN